MPELRKDPVVGRWVIIATERARRPGTFIDPDKNYFVEGDGCQFCNNQEPEIYAAREKPRGPWRVKVVPSGTPLVRIDKELTHLGQGLYDVLNAYGVHEVVIETPDHIANMADLGVDQIQLVLETYIKRFNALENDSRMQYVIAYKNYGWAAGSRRIGHSRSQIIATPVNPLRVKEKLVNAKEYFDFHERCIYCDLINQEKTVRHRLVTENDHFIAATPFAPRFPFEVWIIPKEHHCDFAKGLIGHENDLALILKDILVRIKIGLDDPAYNYVIHTAPFRRENIDGHIEGRWNTIEDDYHWHIEVMPRLTRAAGFEKGTGFYICHIPPEHTAEFLREVEIHGTAPA